MIFQSKLYPTFSSIQINIHITTSYTYIQIWQFKLDHYQSNGTYYEYTYTLRRNHFILFIQTCLIFNGYYYFRLTTWPNRRARPQKKNVRHRYGREIQHFYMDYIEIYWKIFFVRKKIPTNYKIISICAGQRRRKKETNVLYFLKEGKIKIASFSFIFWVLRGKKRASNCLCSNRIRQMGKKRRRRTKKTTTTCTFISDWKN